MSGVAMSRWSIGLKPYVRGKGSLTARGSVASEGEWRDSE